MENKATESALPKRHPLLQANGEMPPLFEENKDIIGKLNLTLPRGCQLDNESTNLNYSGPKDLEAVLNPEPKGICNAISAKFSLLRKHFQNEETHKALNEAKSAAKWTIIMILIVLSVLFVIYVVQTKHSKNEPTFLESRDLTNDGFCWAWENILNNLQGKSEVHFQVTPDKTEVNVCKITQKDGGIEVTGRPLFCKQSVPGTPLNLKLSAITHLHLSHMKDCDNYLKLVLSWDFPKVVYLKLQRVILKEEEFKALKDFMERHKKTLLRIVIEDSYFCPGLECDPGMMDLPNDLEIHVSRTVKDANLLR